MSKHADPIGDHIRKIAAVLLRQLTEDHEIAGRLTTTALVYELTSVLESPWVTNKQVALDKLVGGLRSRPWEGRGGATWQALERIDLRWATMINIPQQHGAERASLWFKVECPRDDKQSHVNTTCVLKSEAKTMPSSAWAGAAEELHHVVWQIAVDFIKWLVSNRR